MHFVLLNQYYPPDVAPTGRMLHDVARLLVARGHGVTVLCSQRAYDGRERYPPRMLIDGVNVHRLPALGFGRRSYAGKLADYTSFCTALALRLVFLRPRPDLIVCLTTPPYVGLLGKLGASLRGVRHAHWIMDLYPDVMTAHGMLPEDARRRRCLAALTRSELARSAAVVSLGPYMQRRIAPYVRRADALHCIPLWHDPTLAPWSDNDNNPLRAERGWSPGTTVLMYSGNMGLGHRFGEFFEAIRRTQDDSTIHWAFAGGGKRRAELAAFAASDRPANLDLLPYAPNDSLKQHLGSADVHLASLDHRWTGCMVPSKIQNIFAVGRPVIFVGPDDCEPAQWIRHAQAGWVVAENDVDGLLRAVAASRDPATRRRHGQSAQTFAEREFNPDTNCTRLCELFEHSTD